MSGKERKTGKISLSFPGLSEKRAEISFFLEITVIFLKILLKFLAGSDTAPYLCNPNRKIGLSYVAKNKNQITVIRSQLS